MRIADRLGLAGLLIARIVPEVKAKGVRTAHSATTPGSWEYGFNGLQFVLTENVLLGPGEAVTSCSLDVWPDFGKKAFSAVWKPEQPWLPPEIVSCKSGPWVKQLGFAEFPNPQAGT